MRSDAPYSVFVDDNFNYMDESERYHLEDYRDYASAVEACKKLVDDHLRSAFKPGMTAAELYDDYTSFGEDPWIKPKPILSPAFSAWKYAKKRCEEMCGDSE